MTIKKITITLCVAVLSIATLGSFTTSTSADPSLPDITKDFKAGELIVKFKNNDSKKSFLNEKKNLSTDSTTDDSKDIVKVDINDIASGFKTQSDENSSYDKQLTVNKLAELKRDPRVEYVEPNYRMNLDFTPNDTNFGQQWALNNTGQNGGTAGVDIRAVSAWDTTQGNNVKVGVIDTGVLTSHEDLAANIARDSGGRIIGYNFGDNCSFSNFDGTDNPTCIRDDNGHGTHVAGIIAGVGNNAKGISGACPQCKIVPLRVFNTGGLAYSSDVIDAINYAVSNGVKIINMSLGTQSYLQSLQDTINSAYSQGVVVIAAAGNCGATGPDCPVANAYEYPASFDNVVSVSNIDRNGVRASSSTVNDKVDVSAPGTSILSTCIYGNPTFGLIRDNSGYCLATGTSMSTPYTTAVTALILAQNPSFTSDQIVNTLKTNVDDVYAANSGLVGKLGTGRINACRVLSTCNAVYPTVSLTSPTAGQVFRFPNTITLTANASDTTGIQKVEFYVNNSKVGEDTSAPYSFDWTPSDLGTFNVAVKAINTGLNFRFSNSVSISVTDGINWTGWTWAGKTQNKVEMITFNGKLYQSVRGTGDIFYTRSTVDGINWTGWVSEGAGLDGPTMGTFNGRLYQAVRGTGGVFYIRSTTDGINWTGWVSDGAGLNTPTLTVFNGRLYEAVRGTGDTFYIRSTADGINWTGWVSDGAGLDAPTLTVFNGRLYEAVRGTGDTFYIRSTADGINWTGWVSDGAGLDAPTLTVFNGRLYEAVRGNLDDGIYTRSTADGINWTGWVWSGKTQNKVEMINFNGRLYQAVRGTGDTFYIRSTADGINWTGWVSDGAGLDAPTLTVFNGRLYEAVRGIASALYVKYY